MRLRQLVSAALVAALVPAFAAGCGGDEAKGTVTGEATFAGEAIAAGSIQFTPKDGKGLVTGGPISAGKFNVPNVPVGPTVVSVTVGLPPGGPISSAESERASKERQKAKKTLPPNPISIPANAPGNNETFEVKAGANTRNVTITAPAPRVARPR